MTYINNYIRKIKYDPNNILEYDNLYYLEIPHNEFLPETLSSFNYLK